MGQNGREPPRINEIKTMNRGNLYFFIIGALVVVASVLGYRLYQDRKQPQGVQILVGPNGVSIEKN
jgi:predicted negative regulator of RcsB-dependent stress response